MEGFAQIPGWFWVLFVTNIGTAIWQISAVRTDIKHVFEDVHEAKEMARRAHHRIDKLIEGKSHG